MQASFITLSDTKSNRDLIQLGRIPFWKTAQTTKNTHPYSGGT